MSYQIQLQPDGETFSADADHSVLESALAAGLSLPYGCRTGACGACKGKVTQGQVDLGAYAGHALPDSEREAGYALLCCARPRSDLVLAVPKAAPATDIPVKKFPSRVHRLERLAEDVMLVELQLPASESFNFRAGQYIDIVLADGQHRSFSIANAPHRKEFLELHIRRVPGGLFTGQVFESLKVRDILRIEGPLGTFWLNEDSDKPIVLLGGGTGFAPLKALIEHAIELESKRPITFYWGARNSGGLYLDELVRSWQSALPGFRYIPVISGADDAWQGRRGLVHEAVLADFADLSQHEVYVCGAPPMIEAVRNSFTRERGLPADALYADAFTFSTVPAED